MYTVLGSLFFFQYPKQVYQLWFGLRSFRQEAHYCPYICLFFFFFLNKFIHFNWRLINLQYCIGFAIHWHESATVYMYSPSWNPTHLPLHPIPLGHPNAPALSTLSHASNLDWWSIEMSLSFSSFWGILSLTSSNFLNLCLGIILFVIFILLELHWASEILNRLPTKFEKKKCWSLFLQISILFFLLLLQIQNYSILSNT